MITKLKCVLLEDEIPGLTYLKMLCEQIGELEVVKSFTDPEMLLREASTLTFDLCILDIEMPKKNGIEVAQALAGKLVIFTTAYKKHAADAFDVDAVDFVPKPVTKERLLIAVRKAFSRKAAREQERQAIQLNTGKGKTLVEIASIAYITTSEIDSRDKLAVMTDGSTLLLKNISFEALQTALPEQQFCRVNKRQLIALKIVFSFTFDEITSSHIEDGKNLTFSVSEAYRQQFQAAIKGIS